MASLARVPLLRAALVVAVCTALTGCATRYDSTGNRVYLWQDGQGSATAIDYSNPRLPLLPRSRPIEPLWEIPSPYEFIDLSRYSMLAPAQDRPITAIGDNVSCAAPCNSLASGALVVSRADDRLVGRLSTAR